MKCMYYHKNSSYKNVKTVVLTIADRCLYTCFLLTMREFLLAWTVALGIQAIATNRISRQLRLAPSKTTPHTITLICNNNGL